ncbi:MAG: hypothetical protein ACUVUC_14700 [Thermoguttaceae bacterium]
MNYRCPVLVAILSLGLSISSASAQGVLVPVLQAYETCRPAASASSLTGASFGPAVIAGVAYTPTAAAYLPTAAYCPPASYAVPTVAYRPALVQYARPAIAYQPAPAPSPQPYAVYSPAGLVGYSTAYAAPVAVAAGPWVIVRPKVYVEGQPIRNLIRAITP